MSTERATITANSGLPAFAQLLSVPRVRSLVCTSALGRLPLGMTGLAIVLESRAFGLSYATAGLWVAAYTIGMAAFAPLLGRAVDRIGEVRLLPPVAVVFTLTTAVLAFAIRSGQSAWLVALLAFVAGASLPPLNACMRTQWPRLLAPEALSTGYAFEAILVEVGYIGGPLLTAIIAVDSPTAAVIVSGVLGGVGTALFTWFVRQSAGSPSSHPRQRGQVLGSPGVRTVLLATVGIGFSFGAFEVALPAFCELHGDRAIAGLTLATFSLGSMAGGIWFAGAARGASVGRRYRLTLWAFGSLLALPLIAWSIPAMALIMIVAGIPTAPSFAASYVIIDRVAHQSTKTETFAWLGTAVVAGAALGNAVGGLSIGAVGWRAAIGMAVITGFLAATIATVRRRTLQ